MPTKIGVILLNMSTAKNYKCNFKLIARSALKPSVSIKVFSGGYFTVVYFDQCLDAAHPKRWSKSSFTAFFVQKS